MSRVFGFLRRGIDLFAIVSLGVIVGIPIGGLMTKHSMSRYVKALGGTVTLVGEQPNPNVPPPPWDGKYPEATVDNLYYGRGAICPPVKNPIGLVPPPPDYIREVFTFTRPIAAKQQVAETCIADAFNCLATSGRQHRVFSDLRKALECDEKEAAALIIKYGQLLDWNGEYPVPRRVCVRKPGDSGLPDANEWAANGYPE